MSIFNSGNFSKPFNVSQPQLNSSDRTAHMKSKTKYAAAVNLAKNGGVLAKKNGSTYVGSVQTTTTMMTSTASYADLLDVTKGKYLLTPPPSSNLTASFQPTTGDVFYGNFTVTDYTTAKIPVTVLGYPTVNTAAVPNAYLYRNQIVKSGSSAVSVTTPAGFNNANIVVDPEYRIFYDDNTCGMRDYFKNVRLDPSIDLKWTDDNAVGGEVFSSKPYNQQQAQRIIANQAQSLRGFQYPASVHFDLDNCGSKPSISPVAPNAPVIYIGDQSEAPPFTVSIRWMHGFDGGSLIKSYQVYAGGVLAGTVAPKECMNSYTLTGIAEGTQIWVTASNCPPKDRWNPTTFPPEPQCTTLTSAKSNAVVPTPLPVLRLIAVEAPPTVWTLRSSITVLNSQILRVPLGNTLIIPTDKAITNNGTIIINGSITNYRIIVNNGIIANDNLGTNSVRNYGNITNASTGVIANGGGTIANEGGTIANNGGTISNSGGTIANADGTIANNGGTIDNTNGGTILNMSGTINNTSGTITNTSGASIANSGVILNAGTTTGGGGGTTGGGTISGNVTGNTVLNADNNTGGTTVAWSLTSPINYYIAVGSIIYIGVGGPAGSQSIPAPSGNGITYSVENSISPYISVTQATGTTPAHLTVTAAAGSAGAVGNIYAINTTIASIIVNLSNNLSGTDGSIIFSKTTTLPETITLYANGTASPANQTIATFFSGSNEWRTNPSVVISSYETLIISPNVLFIINNSLVNNGNIEFSASCSVRVRNIFTNSNTGTIQNYTNSLIIDNYTVGAFYEIVNAGTFNNRSGGYIQNNSSINNYTGGKFVNFVNGTLLNNNIVTNQSGATFNNFGIIRNQKNLINYQSGTFVNYQSGAIYNYSSTSLINTLGPATNNGTLLNANGSGSFGTGTLIGNPPMTATGVYTGQ
jgi:hypothetical protein